MTNTITNVPRELLADLLGNDHDKRIMAERHLLAMLANTPSPAGVDGLDVVAWRIGFPNNTGYKVYGQRQPWAYEKYGVPSVTVYEVQELCRHSEALAGYAVRDARIATQEAQIKALQSGENSWQSGYDQGRLMGAKHCTGTIDQLRADVADDQQVSVPDCFERYRLADKFCDQRLVTDDHVRAIVVDAFASGYGFGIAAAPVAKQVVMQSTNFTASNGEQRNPRYQGQFEGETHDQAAYRLHWVTAAIESERQVCKKAN